MDAIKSYLKVLFGTKTGRTSFLGMLGIVGAYFNGTISPNEAMVGLFALIQSVNFRDAIKKSGPVEMVAKPATTGGGTDEGK